VRKSETSYVEVTRRQRISIGLLFRQFADIAYKSLRRYAAAT